MTSTLLLVTGMHRSGTSALAELLHHQGATIAPQTLADQPNINAQGFWEDATVVALNEQILAACGTTWFDLNALDARQVAGSLGEDGRRQAREHLRDVYLDAPLAVCKDPRFARTLPFWLPLFEELAIAPGFLLTVRHPVQVAASLQARDGLPPEYACLLWLVYQLDAIRNLAQYDALVVDYQSMLLDPAAVLDTLASSFDLNWSPRSGALPVNAGLQRQRSEHLPLLSDINVVAAISELYQELRATTRLEPAACDALCSRFKPLLDTNANWRELLSRMARKVVTDQAELQSIGEKHSAALTVIADKDQQARELAQSWEQARVTIADKDQQLEELAELGEQARSTIGDKDQQLEELAALWEEARCAIEGKDADLDRLTALWENAQTVVADKDQQLSALAAELGRAREMIDERDRRLADRNAEIGRLYQGWLGLPNRLRRKWQK